MSEGALFRILRARLRAMEEALAALPTASNGQQVTHELEQLVRESLEIPAAMKQLWNTTYDYLAPHIRAQVVELLTLRDPLEALFEEALAVMEHVRTRAQAVGKGCGVARTEDLESALSEMQRIKQFVFQHWPRFEEKDMEEAWAEHLRGESLPLDELFRELQNRVR
jgi:hypothetical protein